MCGIAGILEHQPTGINQNKFLHWALKSMHHRGPDSNGIWNNETYHTGFVRLAIRDISHNGDQPMHSHCGRYVLSFNGEIYNSDAFKNVLIKDGIDFKSTSDTEVLLYSLIKWNAAELLLKLNGIFAFAFFDKQENKLIIARDRVGIKPLYIGWSESGFVYSSQYDHIINHPYCSSNSLNENVIGLFLNLGYVPDKAGIIQNTMLFPHGHYGVIEKGKPIQIKEYYAYPFINTSTSLQLDDVLNKCVDQQMVSDVPVGTFMSGGVDSTLITSYAVKNKDHIQSFTIGTEDVQMDESDAAQAFANIFQTKHQCQFIQEKDVLSIIDENFKAYSEPFADYSSLPTLLLSKMARANVTVALSGDGGDELFWGYPRNQKILNASQAYQHHYLYRNVQLLKEKLLNPKQRSFNNRHLKANNYLEYYYRSLYINGAELWLNKLMKTELTDAYFLHQVSANEGDLDDPIVIMNKIRKLEVDLHLQRILIKVDRASMFSSLEVRVPFLDNDMLDFSAAINYTTCIVDKEGKYNLKKLLASKTNEALVFKPKKGFTVPLADWMRNELKHEILQTVMQMPQHLSVYFHKNILEQMFRLHFSKQQDNSWILWSIYSLIKWDAAHRNVYKA
jgi:asparagine synthase (glutamine-hydrolysing)